LSRNEWMWCKSTAQSLRRMIAQRRDFTTAAVRGCRWMTTRQRASPDRSKARWLPNCSTRSGCRCSRWSRRSARISRESQYRRRSSVCAAFVYSLVSILKSIPCVSATQFGKQEERPKEYSKPPNPLNILMFRALQH